MGLSIGSLTLMRHCSVGPMFQWQRNLQQSSDQEQDNLYQLHFQELYFFYSFGFCQDQDVFYLHFYAQYLKVTLNNFDKCLLNHFAANLTTQCSLQQHSYHFSHQHFSWMSRSYLRVRQLEKREGGRKKNRGWGNCLLLYNSHCKASQVHSRR